MSSHMSMLGMKECPLAMMKVPILDWLPLYTKELFWKDLAAGMTVFVFLVPQGMAYALLAGLPPVYGLYSSTVPLFLYAMLGTSRQLSIGPMAITSLLLGVSTQKFGYDDATPQYISIAMNVSMLVGLITFLLGTCSMGTLSNLISHSVLVGFLTASSLVIAINQMKYILGLSMPRFAYSHQTVLYLLTHLHKCNTPAVVLGFGTWAALLAVREWKQRYVAPTGTGIMSRCRRCAYAAANLSSFMAILFGALAARIIIANGGTIDIVGTIPSGLIAPGFAFVPAGQLLTLFPPALAIAFVAFAGNWAVAKKYAQKYGYEVDATQELLGEGFTIIVGVLFNSFVVSGGLARSAVNAESGAVTQIASCITAFLILFALLCLTSFLYYIPMASLSAVIQVSLISMLDFSTMIAAYHKDRRDCLVMVATFLLTFFVGVTEGLFAGMFISIAVVMRSTAFPHIAILGRLPNGMHYRNIKRFAEAEQIEGITIIRMDASLFFANCSHFKNTVTAAARGAFHTSSKPIHLVIIDASAWIDIDLTGVETLFELKTELAARNIKLAIACVKGGIRDRLRASHFLEQGMEDKGFFFSIDDAIHGRPSRRSFQLDEVYNAVELRPPIGAGDAGEREDESGDEEQGGISISSKIASKRPYASLATDDLSAGTVAESKARDTDAEHNSQTEVDNPLHC